MMTHRLRAHTRQSSASSSTGNQGLGKRKRDVLQDISEEHGSNGSAKQQSASSSGRRASAPRRSSPMAPMAPARRASVRVRRSRRLSEQQSSSTRSTGSMGLARVSGTGSEALSRAGVSSGTTASSAEDEGGMSCDEDLEGMVVDLSFEGVADDSAWRETDGRSSVTAPAQGAAPSSEDGPSEVTDKGAGSDCAGKIETDGIHSSNGIISNGGNSSSESHAGPATRRGRARDRAGYAVAYTASEPQSSSTISTVRDSQVDRRERALGETMSRQDQRTSSKVSNMSASTGGSSLKSQSAEGPAHGIEIAGHARRVESERIVRSSVAADTCTRTPLPAGVEDIDAGAWDSAESHLQNPDYAVEHALYLRTQERRNRPAAYIGSKQKDMRQSMRSVLVDWIVEVCDQFKLSPRTLFQVVELIDRSLTAFEVPRGKLQLLGCACVVLAAKYEEIYAPTAEELAHISDNTYTRAEIISMELVVVNALQFRLTCITPCCFVDRFCRAARSNGRERSLVSYLLELLLQDYQGVSLLPSLKAAAALYLARQTLHPRGCPREAWSRQTEYYTGYTARVLEPCVRRLYALHVRAEGHNLHAVRDKYKRPQLHRVADVTCALEDTLYFGDKEA